MAWIVLAHTWVMAGFQFNWNMIGVVEVRHSWLFVMLSADMQMSISFYSVVQELVILSHFKRHHLSGHIFYHERGSAVLQFAPGTR